MVDPESFLEIANTVSKLPMFPYFFTAHCIVMMLYYKEDIGAGAHLFSRKHPLACWICAMIEIFGGGMLACFLLGEPILAELKNTNYLLIATASWYLIFYMPFDFVYKICKFLPVKIILSVMKEIMRTKKIHDGVLHAAARYPSSYVIMVIIGTMKGNGTAFLKVLERLLRGVWTPTALEILNMSFASKASICASMIFVLDQKTDLIAAPHALTYFGIVLFMTYLKLSSMILGIHDPLRPLENLFCALFLGGIWDTLQRVLTPASKGDQSAVKGEAAKNGKSDSAKKKE